MSPHPGLLSSPSTPTLQKPTSCRRGGSSLQQVAPLCEAEDKTTLPPHQLSVLQMQGAGVWPAWRPLPELLGREGPHHALCQAVPGGRASGERGEGISSQPHTDSSTRTPSLLPSPSPVPAPESSAAAAAASPPHRLRSALAPLSGSLNDFSAAAPWPRSRLLLPALHLAPEAAATGAVRRTPPPDRDTSHLPDRASCAPATANLARFITMAAAAAREQSVLEAKSGRGPM